MTTTSSTEESTLSESMKLSMAISCIWAWLIPHFYIEFMEYRLALQRSSVWGTRHLPTNNNNYRRNAEDNINVDEDSSSTGANQANNIDEEDNGDDDDDDDDDIHPDARKAMTLGAGAAVLIILFVYTGSALGIALPTQNMDRRADAIVVGLGRILSAFLFAVFSTEIPRWMGVTYSSQRGNYYKNHISNNTAISVKELSFRVCWSILGHFFVMYIILCLYFCNPDAWTIQLSTASE
jgi:hypothetical protein